MADGGADVRIVAANLKALGLGGQNIVKIAEILHGLIKNLPPSTAFADADRKHDKYTAAIIVFYDQVREQGLDVLSGLAKLLEGHGGDIGAVADILGGADAAATDVAGSNPPAGGRR
jgi:hypothetical protein